MFRSCPGTPEALPEKPPAVRVTGTAAHGKRLHHRPPNPPAADHFRAHREETRRDPTPRSAAYTRGYADRSRTRIRRTKALPDTQGRRRPATGPSAGPLVAAGNALATRRRTVNAAATRGTALMPTTRFRPHPTRSTTARPARGSGAAAGTPTERPGPRRHLRGAADSLRARGAAPPGSVSGRSSHRGSLPRTADDGELPVSGVRWQSRRLAAAGYVFPVRTEGRFGGEGRGPVGVGCSGPAPRPARKGVRRPGAHRRLSEPVKPGSRAPAAAGRTALTEVVQLRTTWCASRPRRDAPGKEPTARRSGEGRGLHAHSSVSRGILVRGAAWWRIRAIEGVPCVWR